jgi:release factor glutamine methyltransferase
VQQSEQGSRGPVTELALDLTRKAATVFSERGFENARLEAELLLAGVLGMKRLELYLQHDRPVSRQELDGFRAAVRRRLRHEPLQYVLGTAAFRQLELEVDSRVLIPRPETEVLVGLVLEWTAARAGRRAPGSGAGAVLDIGTGSGAIALSLAAEGGFDVVVATDVSGDALEVARSNARRLGLAERVEFRGGALFEPVAAGERFAAIVSNPPYVAETERDSLAAEVRDHEPALALYGGAGGLDVITDLIEQAAGYMEAGALLAVEIGAGQSEAVLRLLRSAGTYTAERVVGDLTGRERFALAERVAY